MKILEELIPLAYNLSKKVFENELTHKQAKYKLSENGQMNENSAADYINNFKYLLDGKKFTKTLNEFSMRYFLRRIFKDYGKKGLNNALIALGLHIEYYEGTIEGTAHSSRKIQQDFMSQLNDLLPNLYYFSKADYAGIIERSAAKKQFIEILPNTKTSLQDYFGFFKNLKEGTKFTYQMSEAHLKYFVDNIIEDFEGTSAFLIIRSLELSSENYKGYKKISEEILKATSEDKLNIWFEEQAIEELRKEQKAKKEILEELLSAQESEDVKTQYSYSGYKRNASNIARIKTLRGFKCQICQTSILKKDGTFYTEAAHINPKRLRGKETLDNIILLCPNHHKEFDFGDTKIIKLTKKIVEFKMNGKFHQIPLEIKINE